MNQLNKSDNDTFYHWRLNERHYGSLQGLNKSETARKYGDEQVLIWRRSYDVPPPEMDINDKRHPKYDVLYKNVDTKELPNSESLKKSDLKKFCFEKIDKFEKYNKKFFIKNDIFKKIIYYNLNRLK